MPTHEPGMAFLVVQAGFAEESVDKKDS